MRALLIYPQNPDTFWSFKHALRFIAKKAMHPPLGLLTIAAMLPQAWEIKLVDENVESLSDQHLQWADLAFISAMAIQGASMKHLVVRCKDAGVRVVAGGPLFTSSHHEFQDIDHFVLGEAEVTLPRFLRDLEAGCAGPLYGTGQFPELGGTPPPRWDLIKFKRYASMSIQYSRGCPYNCEFCDITTLFGRKVRTKGTNQLLAELESLRAAGWRGSVFIVDDNFIGNKPKLKREVLPALIEWMDRRRRPFTFSTEASIDLSDDEELMNLMVRAGFEGVFVGIETPSEASLAECGKLQNKGRDLAACVRKIQRFGMEVRGGFIVGFDHDSPEVFENQIELIQSSRIVTAMVGLLNAPRGSRLYQRVAKEGRLLREASGDNTDFFTNLEPKMGLEALYQGYRRLIAGIYAPGPYYERVRAYLREYKFQKANHFHFHPACLRLHSGYSLAFFKSLLLLGIKDQARWHYWKLLIWSTFRRPRMLPRAMTFAIYGFHFRQVFLARSRYETGA